VELHAEGLNVVGTIGAASEIRQIELDLVPSFIEAHGHGTDEGLHASRGLVIGRAETTTDVLVIEDLNLKSEILFEILDDHDQEGELDSEGLLSVSGAGDVSGTHVRAHDLKDGGLNVLIRDALDVAIANLLVEDLQGLGSNAVKDGQEPRLEGVLEHFR